MIAKIIYITLLCTASVLAVDPDPTTVATTVAATTGTGPTTVASTGSTGDTGATTIAGCVDIDADCAKYATTLCTKPAYAQLMFQQCKKTCGMCNGNNAAPCQDSHANCLSWNRLGYCSSTFYTTEVKKANCPKTCNMCDSMATTVAGCVDKNRNCAAWDAKGYCASAVYTDDAKKTNCAKTCKKC